MKIPFEKTKLNSGYARIVKTLKLVKDNGMGAEIEFGYRIRQFKCKNGCEHHNHLVCVECGRNIYIDNVTLEDMQDHLAHKNGFTPKKHNFQIYGVCQDCQR